MYKYNFILLLLNVIFSDSPVTSTIFYKEYLHIEVIEKAANSKKLDEKGCTYLSSELVPMENKLALINALSWKYPEDGKAPLYNFNTFSDYLSKKYNQKFDENSKIITQISTTSSSIQDKVETLIQDPLITHSQMKDELGKVQVSLKDLSTQVADFSKLRDSINTILETANLYTDHEYICLAYLRALDDYFNMEVPYILIQKASDDAKNTLSYNIIKSLIETQEILSDMDQWCMVWKNYDSVINNKNFVRDLGDGTIKNISSYMLSYKYYCKK